MLYDYVTCTNIPCPIVKVVAMEHEGDPDAICILEVIIPDGIHGVAYAESLALALTDWLEELHDHQRLNRTMDAALALGIITNP